MTRLFVEACGPGMTVQDAGRIGAQRFGISGSGAMDLMSYRLANALVGADADAAVLEFAVFGGSFSLDAPALVAVTGGDCPITVDGRPVAPWTSFTLAAGAKLSVGALKDAVYGYIALGGGIDVPPFMGSRATHSRSRIGGFQGRALVVGDVLDVFAPAAEYAAQRLVALPDRGAGPIRVVAGPQDAFFTPEAWQSFLSEPFVITSQRDRMGMMLDGPTLAHAAGYNIVSDAVAFGSIQVPGTGKPIILLADRQSTGGYPKIATIASCDLGRLAQMRSGENIRFQRISADEAEALARDAQRSLQHAIDSLEPLVAHPDLSSERLLEVNLIDGVDSAAEERRSGPGFAVE